MNGKSLADFFKARSDTPAKHCERLLRDAMKVRGVLADKITLVDIQTFQKGWRWASRRIGTNLPYSFKKVDFHVATFQLSPPVSYFGHLVVESLPKNASRAGWISFRAYSIPKEYISQPLFSGTADWAGYHNTPYPPFDGEIRATISNMAASYFSRRLSDRYRVKLHRVWIDKSTPGVCFQVRENGPVERTDLSAEALDAKIAEILEGREEEVLLDLFKD